MTTTDYKAIFGQLKADIAHKRRELGECLQRQELLEHEISNLQQSAAALARLLKEEFVVEDELGLTDAIRKAFKESMPAHLIPTEVRTKLEEMQYDISKYGNVMASIHSVINRLHSKGEIVEVGQRGDGRTAYRWHKK